MAFGKKRKLIEEYSGRIAQYETEREELQLKLAQALRQAEALSTPFATVSIGTTQSKKSKRFHWRARDADGKLLSGSPAAGPKPGFESRAAALTAGSNIFAQRWRLEVEDEDEDAVPAGA